MKIPDRVVEAAETAYTEALGRMGFSAQTMRAAITAALEEWVKSGEATIVPPAPGNALWPASCQQLILRMEPNND